MKRTLVVVLALVVVVQALLISPLLANSVPDRVVYPTGDWPADVQNVQAALDLGGVVVLKATDAAGRPTQFNFGDPAGTVCGKQVGVQHDVSIIGESVSGMATTIAGGFRPILVGLSSGGWCSSAGFAASAVEVRIEGITFDGPLQAAVDVYKARSVDIVGNRVFNVRTAFGLGIGMNVFGGGSQRRVTGKVTIADNLIRFPAAEGGFVHGIVLDNVPADVDIVRNTVQNTQDFTGILVVRQVEGTVRIAQNLVMPHRQVPGRGGIGIYVYANDRWNAIRRSAPIYEIVGNRVITEGSVGIGMVGQGGAVEGAVLEHNHISMLRSSTPDDSCPGCVTAGISFGGNVSDARVSSNRIDGPAHFAIELFDFESAQRAGGNVFTGNNLTQFAAETADVFLGPHSRRIVLAGRAGVVIDQGSDNQITGATAIGPGLGVQIGRRPFQEPASTSLVPE